MNRDPSTATFVERQTHILVVDDDPSIRQMLVDYLSDFQIRVTSAASAREMMHAIREEMPDLLVLDLRLPDEDGLALARRLRSTSSLPIIILTGCLDEADRVMSLELCADDYLTKPFSLRELLARIRALLRRSRTTASLADDVAKVRAYRFEGWELNVPLRKLTSPSKGTVDLSIGEFNLLAVFLTSPRRVLDRSYLLDQSHVHSAEVFDRSVDVQVRRLRRRLEQDPANPSLILTRRGEGYLFNAVVDVLRS